MIIKINWVIKPRKIRCCNNCGKVMIGACISMWGYAERGDKPSYLWMHESCISEEARRYLYDRRS